MRKLPRIDIDGELDSDLWNQLEEVLPSNLDKKIDLLLWNPLYNQVVREISGLLKNQPINYETGR